MCSRPPVRRHNPNASTGHTNTNFHFGASHDAPQLTFDRHPNATLSRVKRRSLPPRTAQGSSFGSPEAAKPGIIHRLTIGSLLPEGLESDHTGMNIDENDDPKNQKVQVKTEMRDNGARRQGCKSQNVEERF